MKIYPEHDSRVRTLCVEQRYIEARDFLLSLKAVYQSAPSMKRAPYYLHLARTCSMLGDYRQADHFFDLTFGAFPNFNFARIMQADSYIQRGAFREASEALAMLVDSPDYKEKISCNIHLHQTMGHFFKLIGDYAEAEVRYQEGVALCSHEGSIHKDLQFVRFHLRQEKPNPVAGMIEYVQFLRKRDRALKVSAERLGVELDSNLAVSFLTNRLRLPTSLLEELTCHTMLSKCYMEAGHLTAAREHLQRAQAVDPRNLDVIITDIMCDIYDGHQAEARQKFAQNDFRILAMPKKAISLASAFHYAGAYDIAALMANTVLESPDVAPSARRTACKLLADVPAPH